ncbi:hypothetical protein SAMN04515695_5518 [Pseudovibrio sp. Tun.PSC04-5.I4]|nr:hypothetical protein SAMN04515695_5518 [Pseudovibrio sp. Tun.PSC04-5.I4]
MALPWGNARTQFQLVRAQVEAELGRGVSKRKIFEALRDEGKIDMTKRTFYKYAAKALNPMAELAQGSAIGPPPKTGGSRTNSPPVPLLPSQPAAKNRFQMASKIPDYE